MSIATRTGDDGTTALMYGRRVSKAHPRVAAYGNADELSASLGMARATARDSWVHDLLHGIQTDLIGLMGELAVDDTDRERYLGSKLARLEARHLERLDSAVATIEARQVKFDGWATPGDTLHAGALDMARTVCRRTERGIVALAETGAQINAYALRYLNRLSDLLWLLARLDETISSQAAAAGGGSAGLPAS